MDWCERQGIDYVFGLAKNPRLLKEIDEELKAAEAESVRPERWPGFSRIFAIRRSRKPGAARAAWSPRPSTLNKGSNPRFVVTSLPRKVVSGGGRV